jgi:hypothetical protein
VSPSGSFLKLVIEEERDPAVLEAVVNRLVDGNDDQVVAFVQLQFRQSIGSAVHGYDTGHFEPKKFFEASAVEAAQKARPGDRETFLARWRQQGFLEDTGVYEVMDSIWDGAPLSDRFRHFVIEGSELWMEVIARSCEWIWVDVKGEPLGGGAQIEAPPKVQHAR